VLRSTLWPGDTWAGAPQASALLAESCSRLPNRDFAHPIGDDPSMATRRHILLALGAIALVAAALLAAKAWRDHERWDRAGERWNALARCLVGADGVVSNDPVARLRTIELAVAIAQPQPIGERWPLRCAPHADALIAALAELRGDATADTLSQLLAQSRRPHDLRGNAARLWALAAELPHKQATASIVEPPRPVIPRRPPKRATEPFVSFHPRGRSFTLFRQSAWYRQPGDNTCVLDRELRSMLCEDPDKRSPSEAEAHRVHGDARWRLVEDRDREPWPEAHPSFAIDRKRQRIDYRLRPRVWVAADGTISLLVRSPDTVGDHLFRAAPGETTATEVRLPGPRQARRVVVGHWLSWLEYGDDITTRMLRFDASADDPQELQTLPDTLGSEPFQCDHEGALRGLFVHGGLGGTKNVLIEHEGRFLSHQGPPSDMLPPEVSDGPYDFEAKVQFTCTPSGARIAVHKVLPLPHDSADCWRPDSPSDCRMQLDVTVFDCNKGGCTRATQSIIAHVSFTPVVVPLEHKVAIILNTIHYGVQLVVAPQAEQASAPTEVLLDERVRMIHVAHRVDAAAVVFALDPVTDTKSKIVRWHSIAALRIDQSGAVTRVTHRESK
jgi:hypothetical protein